MQGMDCGALKHRASSFDLSCGDFGLDVLGIALPAFLPFCPFFTLPAILLSFLYSASSFMCLRSAFLGIFPLIYRPRATISPQAFGCSTVLVKHRLYVLVQHVHFLTNYLHI